MIFEGESLKDYKLDFKDDKLVRVELPNVEGQKFGEWIEPDKYCDKNIWRKCSNCGTDIDLFSKYKAFDGSIHYMKRIARYCNVCGAKMKGEKDEQCESGASASD